MEACLEISHERCSILNKYVSYGIHMSHYSPSIGISTYSIRYWELRIRRSGIRDLRDIFLDYFQSQSDVDDLTFDKTLPISACMHEINMPRSKLKDMVANATAL
jgi:hypothetical protein